MVQGLFEFGLREFETQVPSGKDLLNLADKQVLAHPNPLVFTPTLRFNGDDFNPSYTLDPVSLDLVLGVIQPGRHHVLGLYAYGTRHDPWLRTGLLRIRRRPLRRGGHHRQFDARQSTLPPTLLPTRPRRIRPALRHRWDSQACSYGIGANRKVTNRVFAYFPLQQAARACRGTPRCLPARRRPARSSTSLPSHTHRPSADRDRSACRTPACRGPPPANSLRPPARQARVAACSSAAGTAWLIRPHSAAVRAGTISPVSSICMARLRPMARVRATIGVVQKSPIFTPGVAKAASSAAMARSQVATNWHPAAVAIPCTSAITGCGIDWTFCISSRAHVEDPAVFIDVAAGHLAEIVAGAKYFAASGQNHRADLAIAADLVRARRSDPASVRATARCGAPADSA